MNALIGGGPRRAHEAERSQVELLFGAAFDALLVVDDHKRYVRVNDAGAALLGAPRDRILASRIPDFTAPEHLPAMARLWSHLQTYGGVADKYLVLRGDGGRQPIRFQATSDFGPNQHLIVAREMPSLAVERDLEVLTAREREVMQLAADGHPVGTIGRLLHVAPGTVKTHFQNIYPKLGVHDRASAVAEALRRGLIE